MNSYLVAAYAVIWIVLLGYVFSLGRKSQRLSDELQRLKEYIEKSGQ